MEYIKKVDLLEKAVEVEYLNRPRLMVSVATIGKMPSIEAVPMEYHNKVCEEMARRHQAEILELTKDRQQGEWIKDAEWWCVYKCSVCGETFDELTDYCPHCGARRKGADDE